MSKAGKQRKPHSPRTGEKVMMQEDCTVTFKPGLAIEQRGEYAAQRCPKVAVY